MPGVVLVISQKDFDDKHFSEIRKYVDEAWGTTFFCSKSKTGTVSDKKNEIVPNMDLKDIIVEDLQFMDAIIFINGTGTLTNLLYQDKTAHQICQDTLKQGKVLAAIGNSVNVILNSGIAKDKKMTGDDADKDNISKIAKYTGNNVEIDGLLITGKSGFTKEFADAINKKIAELRASAINI